MSMRIFFFACLLAAPVDASADRPDGDDPVITINLPDSPGSNRYSGVVRTCTTEAGTLPFGRVESVGGSVRYSLVGETDRGTYVLHTVDRSDGFVDLHELLLIRPVSEAGALHEEEHRAVTLGDGRYVIEKLETIPVDDPYDASVKVEGNAIVVTISSP